jgi:hypothetical protein
MAKTSRYWVTYLEAKSFKTGKQATAFLKKHGRKSDIAKGYQKL